jgi:antirestriction protein
MNYKSYPVGVHTNENSVKVLEGIVQYDNANLFQIQLYDGAEAFDFSGYSVINVAIVRPDETPIADIWTAITAEQADNGEQSVLADETTTGGTESHTFLAIQYLDPVNGRITLRVGGEATAQVGLHRMVLEIYAGDAVLTTARINYNVVETANKVGTSILQKSEGYVALQDLVTECASIIEAERERGNQEAIRQDQEAARQTSVSEMLATLATYMSTLSQAIERAEDAAAAAQQYASLASAVSIDDFPANLKAAVISANENIEDLAEVQARVSTLETKSARFNLSSDDGYLYLPVVTSATISSYFSGHTTVGAVVLNSTDGALYIGTGSGAYRIVKDPDAFPGYVVAAAEPTNTEYLWIDSGSGNLMKYYDNGDWVETKSVAVFG